MYTNLRVNLLLAKIIYGEDYRFFMSGSEIAEDNRRENESEQTNRELERGLKELQNNLK